MACRLVLSHPPALYVRIAVSLALAFATFQLSARAMVDPDAASASEKFLARSAPVREYRAFRRLEASGVGQRGWMDVETTFTVASGFQYQVKAEGGSGYIRGRVLRSLLDEEQRLIAGGESTKVALSRSNYRFSAEAIDAEGLAVVKLEPLRKERALIAGRLFLSATDGDLVRAEGRLAKNPSFWTTRVDVVRSYRRINGTVMPVLLETTAHLRFLGSSALRMTYEYSHIDDQPVDDQDAEPAP